MQFGFYNLKDVKTAVKTNMVLTDLADGPKHNQRPCCCQDRCAGRWPGESHRLLGVDAQLSVHLALLFPTG